MKNFSLGMKISFGFGLLIIIAIALGSTSIWNMKNVEEQSVMLAEEYVPEVDVAVELRGAANRMMYEMRGYGFTEEEKFYQNAQKEIKAVETALEKGRVLDEKSPNLKKLKPLCILFHRNDSILLSPIHTNRSGINLYPGSLIWQKKRSRRKLVGAILKRL